MPSGSATRAPADHTMSAVQDIQDGHYARKQLQSGSSLVSFTHGARFRKAVELALQGPRGSLLDYGSGDGTFLKLVADGFTHLVGADVVQAQIDDCRRRFAAVPHATFVHTSALAGEAHRRAYDTVMCMEVLEHCTPTAVDLVLADLERLVAPAGRVVISVPIETGPTFLLKYVGRAVAGWRTVPEYRYYERYPPFDALRMLFATRRTQLRRPVYGEPGAESHSHYGFNWRRLRDRVAQDFQIDEQLFTPFGASRGLLSSQAWLVCRLRRNV